MSRVLIAMGTEGPRHDPYGYTEYTVQRPNGDSVTLHEGLVVWIEVNSDRYDNVEYERAVEMFTKVAGCSPKAAEKAYHRVMYTCPKCQGTELYGMPGLPGETIMFCVECDVVVCCDFDESAII